MSIDYIAYLSTETIMTAIKILLPILGAALGIGLLISIFQATTSIQEITLTFVPKIAIVGIVILLILPWMLNILLSFTVSIFHQVSVIN